MHLFPPVSFPASGALTFRIKTAFPVLCLYLVLRNLRRQRHPVLKQADDLVIGGTDLVADFPKSSISGPPDTLHLLQISIFYSISV